MIKRCEKYRERWFRRRSDYIQSCGERNVNRIWRERINPGLSPHARGQVDRNTLASKVSRQIPNKLDLLIDRKPTNDSLEHGANRHSVFADQTAIINVGEDTHQESKTLSAKTEV